jgi:cytochrome c-type biogenesis protein CcmH
MILWLAFALMTAAAIFAVLWPLARRTPGRSGRELAVYRDQLDEIARDRAAGLIGEAEAQAAKIEVSRRLIAAADSTAAREPPSSGSPLWRRRIAAIAGLVLVPVGATALYLALGSPQMPGEPLQARLHAIHDDRSVAGLVAQVEALARNPNDERGYAVLAPVYLQLGRFDDAVNARRKVVLVLVGATAERQADLGEALTAQANGVVTAEAKTTFERALALDSKELKARFFVALAAEQDGDRAKAAARPRGSSRMAAISRGGNSWCAPIWCSTSATRRSPPRSTRATRSPPRPASCVGSRTSSKAWGWKVDEDA